MTRLTGQKLRLLFSSVTLIIAVVGFVVANHSFAWFSNNKAVKTNGLSVNTRVSPNLIIGKTVAELTASPALRSVDFNGTAQKNMIAVTHDDAAGDTNLKYLYNNYAVNRETGLADTGATLIFENVPAENDGRYFTDYTVYIASAFGTLEASSLTATIVIPEAVDTLPSHFMAASIDLYVGEITDESYKGTTAVADVIGTEKKSIELLAEGGETIPLNTDGYLTVTLRCYFDGALTTPDGSKTYINSNEATTDGIVFGVEFIATEKSI